MTTYTISPYPRSEFEPSPRWVRVYFSSQPIADSRSIMLLRENNRLPLYYFPKHDVRMDCLKLSDHTTDSDPKGEGVFWHVQVGDKVADNAAFSFRNPPDDGPKLEDYVAFQWKEMDAWFEEDDEVFVYARDPYKRVDVLQSSRPIKVVVDGAAVADSKRPWLLFETGLPTRYYIPKHDARTDLLEPSDTVTRCPSKGEAHFYSVRISDKLHQDLAWTYRYPMLECLKIQGLLGFLNEKVDIFEDDKLLPRPETPWS